MKITNKDEPLSILHINACSLNKNFDVLECLAKCSNKQFDIAFFTETRINRNGTKLYNAILKNYAVELISNESSPGGTLLCLSNHVYFKAFNDPDMCKNFELESTFIEVIIPKKVEHPSMDLIEFKIHHTNVFLDEIS